MTIGHKLCDTKYSFVSSNHIIRQLYLYKYNCNYAAPAATHSVQNIASFSWSYVTHGNVLFQAVKKTRLFRLSLITVDAAVASSVLLVEEVSCEKNKMFVLNQDTHSGKINLKQSNTFNMYINNSIVRFKKLATGKFGRGEL